MLQCSCGLGELYDFEVGRDMSKPSLHVCVYYVSQKKSEGELRQQLYVGEFIVLLLVAHAAQLFLGNNRVKCVCADMLLPLPLDVCWLSRPCYVPRGTAAPLCHHRLTTAILPPFAVCSLRRVHCGPCCAPIERAPSLGAQAGHS